MHATRAYSSTFKRSRSVRAPPLLRWWSHSRSANTVRSRTRLSLEARCFPKRISFLFEATPSPSGATSADADCDDDASAAAAEAEEEELVVVAAVVEGGAIGRPSSTTVDVARFLAFFAMSEQKKRKVLLLSVRKGGGRRKWGRRFGYDGVVRGEGVEIGGGGRGGGWRSSIGVEKCGVRGGCWMRLRGGWRLGGDGWGLGLEDVGERWKGWGGGGLLCCKSASKVRMTSVHRVRVRARKHLRRRRDRVTAAVWERPVPAASAPTTTDTDCFNSYRCC